MTFTGMSQKEYLKKYLSSGSDDKKKKKKKPKANPVNRLRIVDDDVDIHNMRPLDEDELELYDLQEDAPQIAGIIDERPEEVKIREKFGSKKWKVVADENDMGVKIIDKSNSKINEDTGKNVLSHVSGVNSDRDLSSPRKSGKDSEKVSQNNKQYFENVLAQRVNDRADSDESPPRKSRNENPEASFQTKKGRRYVSDESFSRLSRKSNVSNIQDSDESPPRRDHKTGTDNKEHGRKEHKYDSDQSPPRKGKKNNSENVHQGRKKQSYSSDESVLWRNKNVVNTSPRRKEHKPDSDVSPPRQKKRPNKDASHSRWHKYDSDESPPRRIGKYSSENEYSHKKLHKYDSDELPSRRGRRRSSESPLRKEMHNRPATKTDYHRNFQSPSRNRKGDSPSSFRMKGNTKHSEKRSQKSDSDESPPRRGKRRESISPPSRGSIQRKESFQRKESRKTSVSPPTRNRKEVEYKELSRRPSRWTDADDSALSARRDLKPRMSSPVNIKGQNNGNSSHRDINRNDHKNDGRNSASQRRPILDHSPDQRVKQPSKDAKKQTLDGRKAGLVDADELKAEIANLRHQEKEMFEKMDVNVSGRGAAPIMRDRKTGKKRDLEEEAREKLKKDEKQAERDEKYMQWGKGLKQVNEEAQKMEDALYEMSKPLARYADDADLDKFLREQVREGDPMLAYIKSKSKNEDKKGKPQYEGTYMPNRYGIRPGYRWDGVDRSNGYEKQWFETQNTKKAVEEEAYKWSTADM